SDCCVVPFCFSSRRRHTRCYRDWSSDVCSSDLLQRDDVYTGPFLKNASELQVGFADGYRVSWQTSLGGSPPGIVYPNMKKWSGDHGSYDYKSTAGTLITSRALDGSTARSVMDIAPTVLKYFGVPIPSDIDGK